MGSANSSIRVEPKGSPWGSVKPSATPSPSPTPAPYTELPLRSLSLAAHFPPSHHVVTYVTRERGDGMMSLRQIEVAA